MLRQLRHISEGNFYGLHVTNKAEKLSLEKELKTLEACQDAQSHGYRKEENELVETLRRLNRSKHPNDEDMSGKDHDGADEASIGHESGLVFAKPAAGVSDESIVIPLSPVEDPTTDSGVVGGTATLPVQGEEELDIGSDLHRTTGFTDCALCKLPRYKRGHGREAGKICTCGPEHRRHIHVDKYQDESEKPRKTKSAAKKYTKEDLVSAVQEHDRMKNMETEHHVHDFLATLGSAGHADANGHRNPQQKGHDSNNHGGAPAGGNRRISIGERQERGESNTWISAEGHGAPLPGFTAQARGSMAEHVDFLSRSRRSSIEEQYGQRSRHGSLEEQAQLADTGSRRGSYMEHHQSASKKALNDDQHHRRQLFGFDGHQRRSFASMNKNRTVSTAGDVYHVRAPPQLPNIHPPAQMPVFHGLVHPDNIINHHYFLPHQAEKHDNQRRASFHCSRSNHHHGHPSYSHIAAAFDRKHEQDSSTYRTISTLRKMLYTYQDKEKDESPKYPWPRPPVVEFTTEEFQKLKKCRYLRLPKKSAQDDETEEYGNGEHMASWFVHRRSTNDF